MEKDDFPRSECAERGETVSVEPEQKRRLVNRTTLNAPAAPPGLTIRIHHNAHLSESWEEHEIDGPIKFRVGFLSGKGGLR